LDFSAFVHHRQPRRQLAGQGQAPGAKGGHELLPGLDDLIGRKESSASLFVFELAVKRGVFLFERPSYLVRGDRWILGLGLRAGPGARRV
jgi:hypothetical protein